MEEDKRREEARREGERTKESEARVGGCQKQGDKREGKGEDERTDAEEDKPERKSILPGQKLHKHKTRGFLRFGKNSEITVS